ncbi:MAG: DUF5069 domain-containing protein [Chthoniobacterales bacterium]
MSDYDWTQRFLELHQEASERYQDGAKTPSSVLKADEIEWLAEMGCSAQEFFDFIEDFCRGEEPDAGTALLVAAKRRDYFLSVQKGRPEPELPSSTLPPKTEEVKDIPWLPRLIEKAKRKLRGQMDDDLMYGCGGDRNFFQKYEMHPADFLKLVEDSKGKDAEVVAFIVKRGKDLNV